MLGNTSPCARYESTMGNRDTIYFVTSLLHGGEQSTSRPSYCNHGGRASSTSWVCPRTCLKT